MKFQWIGVLVFIGIVNCLISSQKLTVKENEERLKSCGNTFLPIPSINQTGKGFGFFNDKTYTYNSKSGWLLLAGHKNRSTRVYATAFPISEYHILISSRVMLTAEHKWIMNGKPFDKNNCSGGRHLDVPRDVLDNILFWYGKKPKKADISKARMFFACDNQDLKAYPVLIELNKTSKRPWAFNGVPCLADETTSSKLGDVVHSYGYTGESMQHRKLSITAVKDERICTDTYKTEKAGGPLILNVSGKATVIGLKAPASRENCELFYDLSKLQKEICDYSGVCGHENPILTTEPTPVTTERSTVSTTISTSLETTIMQASSASPISSKPATTTEPSPLQASSKPATEPLLQPESARTASSSASSKPEVQTTIPTEIQTPSLRTSSLKTSTTVTTTTVTTTTPDPATVDYGDDHDMIGLVDEDDEITESNNRAHRMDLILGVFVSMLVFE
ncbi:Peptidase S1 domain-containing protein [Caenorhabditis elegans]|uniref:Peptidase S1 domain-containing protein n=1 Tax=Caenorhabditis elegans TaxID=6239 RepID=Q9U2W2_CAEEL|nr:Peptidase S1 domain-containing protein [Caenorhabditis elegans]CAB55163.2 Peptidase S1 domain-containing protein [Caenorhabditis elegans]|eukprot:NP_502994.2 Uncharacterized protein CELE_Y116A8A.6 [Caenorhabditis elegans]